MAACEAGDAAIPSGGGAVTGEVGCAVACLNAVIFQRPQVRRTSFLYLPIPTPTATPLSTHTSTSTFPLNLSHATRQLKMGVSAPACLAAQP